MSCKRLALGLALLFAPCAEASAGVIAEWPAIHAYGPGSLVSESGHSRVTVFSGDGTAFERVHLSQGGALVAWRPATLDASGVAVFHPFFSPINDPGPSPIGLVRFCVEPDAPRDLQFADARLYSLGDAPSTHPWPAGIHAYPLLDGARDVGVSSPISQLWVQFTPSLPAHGGELGLALDADAARFRAQGATLGRPSHWMGGNQPSFSSGSLQLAPNFYSGLTNLQTLGMLSGFGGNAGSLKQAPPFLLSPGETSSFQSPRTLLPPVGNLPSLVTHSDPPRAPAGANSETPEPTSAAAWCMIAAVWLVRQLLQRASCGRPLDKV